MSESNLKRLESTLMNLSARQFAHELLLEFILAAAMARRPAAEIEANLDAIKALVRNVYADSRGDEQLARQFTQVIFNVDNFVEKLRRQAQAAGVVGPGRPPASS